MTAPKAAAILGDSLAARRAAAGTDLPLYQASKANGERAARYNRPIWIAGKPAETAVCPGDAFGEVAVSIGS